MTNPLDDKMSEQVDVLFVVPPVIRFLRRSASSFPLGLGYLVAVLKLHNIKAAIYNADYFDPDDDYRRLAPSRKIAHIVHSVLRRLALFRGQSNPIVEIARQWPRFQSHVEDTSHPYWQEVRAVMKQIKPRIVGITSKVVDIPSTIKVVQIAKETVADVTVVIGGPSATTCADYLMRNSQVDFLVRGEGEETFLELAKQIMDKQENAHISRIHGVVYRDSDQTIKITHSRPLISDIDSLPFPDRECIFYVNTEGRRCYYVRADDVLTSRGCPFPCKFCAAHVAWGEKRPRFRTVSNVLREIDYLQTTYGQRQFILWDDLFTANRERVVEFCKEILARGWHISWLCLVRIDAIDEELLAVMKAAGCYEIQVGIESGNDRVLAYIGKHLTTKLIREKTAIIRKSGLSWHAFFIIGFPTETEVEMRDTLNFWKEIKPTHSQLSIFCPYPGTVFYDQLSKQGKLGEKFMKSDVYYPYNNYTGTMSDKQFRQFAFEGFKMANR